MRNDEWEIPYFERIFAKDLRALDAAIETVLSSAKAAGYACGFEKGWRDRGDYENGLLSELTPEEAA